MTRSYIKFPERATVNLPNGGVVRSSGDGVHAPSTMLCTPTDVGFGPLCVGVPDGGSVCSVRSLTYLPEESDSDGGLIFGLTVGAGAASTDSDPDDTDSDTKTTRRNVLALAAATLAAGALGSRPAAGQEETVALNIAELDIENTTAPVNIRVLDVVSNVLPPTTELLVDAENTRVGEIAKPSAGVTLPDTTTGTVRVYLRDSVSTLSRLLSWAAGIVGGDEEITFARDLPKDASKYDEGQFVKMSEHPALVDPVKESEPTETLVKIGNTTIPHNESAGSTEAGSYGIFDDALVYEVGSNPPAASEWTLRTRLGFLARMVER